MELIDKDALVAEIERRKHKLLDNIMFERDKEWVVRTAHQLNRIILFLDDLEVKEVVLGKDSLTWQDINLIHHLLFDIKKDYDNGKLDKEEYYKEVLKQFKEQL